MQDVKRLCIYVTYSKDNKIKEYMGYMLKAIRTYTDELYVVCNYPTIKSGIDYIQPYADDIFYRENKGYDAGAYKDMLCTLLGWNEIYKYDELILMNDSFLGPFYDFGSYFDLMKDVSCDFWGMTRQFSGEMERFKYKYKPHVHSYFLVFRKEVFCSDEFRVFWENFAYPKTFAEAVLNFEVKLNEYLEQYGYASIALTDVWRMTFEENIIPFLCYSLELIRDHAFPILKKKCLLIRNGGFSNTLEAIKYLEKNSSYPVKWIWEQLDSQFYIENYAPSNTNCLELFYHNFKKIYIYGAGVCGKNLTTYFHHKGWQYAGIIVSDKTKQDIECLQFDDVEVDEETGIIVSVIHKEVSEEIVRYIENKYRRDQLFVMYDCTAIRMPE